MKKILSAFFLILGCSLVSTSTKPTTFWASIRLDEPVDTFHFYQGLLQMDSLGWKGVCLEIIVSQEGIIDSLCTLQVPTLVKYLAQTHTPYWLFCSHFEAPPEGKLDYLRTFHQQLTSLLHRLRFYPPSVVIVGNQWQAWEPFEQQWNEFFTALKQQYPALRWSYCAKAGRWKHFQWHQHLDYFMIPYQYPPLQASYGAMAHRINPLLERQLQPFNKPLLLQMNLLGSHKREQLENALRFWNNTTKIQGVLIHTIYPLLPFQDSTTYFGLAKSPSVLAFIKEQGS